MGIKLTFDFEVESRFWWAVPLLPTALMKEIDRRKTAVYQTLSPNPLAPDMRTADSLFTVEGRSFRVFFTVDQQHTHISSQTVELRVVYIDEVEP